MFHASNRRQLPAKSPESVAEVNPEALRVQGPEVGYLP